MASSSPLQWIFELFDKLSGPAKDMGSAAAALGDKLHGAAAASDKLGESHHAAAGHAEGFRHQLFETVVIAKEIGEVVWEAGEKLFEFGGEMLKAAGATEDMKLSLQAMIGDKKEVSEFLERLEKFAPQTQFNTTEIRSMGANLVRSGFKADEIRAPMLAASDLAAINPENKGAANQALEALGNIQQMGVMTTRSMIALRGLKILPEVETNLATAFGVKVEAVKGLIESGAISAKAGEEAIYKAITQKTHDALGGASALKSGNLSSVIHHLASFPETLFENLDEVPAFAKVKGLFSNILGALNDNKGPLLSVIGDTIGSVVDALFGDLSGPGGQARLKEIFGGIIDWIKNIPIAITAAKRAFTEFWSEIKLALIIVGVIKGFALAVDAYRGAVILAKLATQAWETASFMLNIALMAGPMAIIPLIIGAVAALGFVVYEVIKHWDFFKEYIGGFATWVLDKMFAIGASVWQGLVAGIKSGLDAVRDAMHVITYTAVGTASNSFETKSPSKVFERMGGHVAEGFAIGVMNGAPMVSDAMDSTFSSDVDMPTASLGKLGAVGAGAGNRTANVEIHVNADGHGKDVGDAIASKIKDILPIVLANAFEQMAMEAGA